MVLVDEFLKRSDARIRFESTSLGSRATALSSSYPLTLLDLDPFGVWHAADFQ